MNHQTVLALVSAVWVGLELVVGILLRGSAQQDRRSYTVLWVLLMAGTIAGGVLRPIARMPFPDAMFRLGIALMLLGMVIRAAAIITLRRYFTVQVTIQESHDLVDRGLYRFLRHPSYTGALISFVGLGFAFGSWLSLAVISVGALIGFGYRIGVEEAALVQHFGDRYRQYAARTKRLIPGVY